MAASMAADDAPLRVLFVCTGNICRSAMAERLAQVYTGSTLGVDADDLSMGSAGTHAVVGSTMHPYSAEVLARLGGDPRGFAARQLTADTAVAADLTLALTRAHRRSALKMSPRGLSRTFTLLEAADLAGMVQQDVELRGDTFTERFRSYVGHMAQARACRRSDERDDVPDPVSESLEFHEDVGHVIADAIQRLFGRAVELGASRVGAPAGHRATWRDYVA